MEKEEKTYICPSCGKNLWTFNMLVDLKRKYYNSTPSIVDILTEYGSGRKPFPKTYQLICLNEKCERSEQSIDIILLELLEKSMKDQTMISSADCSRESDGKFKKK